METDFFSEKYLMRADRRIIEYRTGLSGSDQIQQEMVVTIYDF